VIRAALYDRAERMYVGGQMSFVEIAAQLACSEKTLRNWATDGHWQEKRVALLADQQSLDSKLYAFVNSLMDSITEDWQKKQPVDPGRLYSLASLISKLKAAKTFEDSQQEEARRKEVLANAGLSAQAIEKIEHDLGLM
jgi:hypothetical protein